MPPSSRICSRSVAALAGTAALRACSTGVSASTLQPRAVAAQYHTVQLRLLLRSRHAPSPRHCSSGFSSTPPRLGLRRVPVISIDRGARLCTLPAAADGSRHSHYPCPRRRHIGIRRVQHPALSVSCASRGGRRAPHSAVAAAVSAPSRAGPNPSGEAHEGCLRLTRLASAPKQPVPPADQLVHRDAAGC